MMLPALNLIAKISKFTGFSADEIAAIIRKHHRKYKLYTIPKSSGGNRIILHPSKELKIIQYAIYESLLKQQEVHEIATAYIPQLKSPLRVTALKHSGFKYTVRIDFQDFFHSLQPVDLLRRLEQVYTVSDDETHLLTHALFYFLKKLDRYVLPVGAPTSPVISNISMCELDESMHMLANRIDTGSVISRYADDVHFSTNIKGKCLEFNTELGLILSLFPGPYLRIHTQKTLYLSRGTRRIITGLFITPDGLVSLGRDRKAQIKSLIYRHSKGLLSLDEMAVAKGLVSFAGDCEPAFLDRLAIKYGIFYYSIKEM